MRPRWSTTMARPGCARATRGSRSARASSTAMASRIALQGTPVSCSACGGGLGSSGARTPWRPLHLSRRRPDGRTRSGPVERARVGRGGGDRRAGARHATRPPATPARDADPPDPVASPGPLWSAVHLARSRAPRAGAGGVAGCPRAVAATRVLGPAHPRPDGVLRPPRGRPRDRLPGGPARLGGAPSMNARAYDVVIIGSGAGGGTVAHALAPMVADGARILVLEKGPRLADDEFTGRELEMATALYEDGGGFLTADGTMTLAFANTYGGSTVVYTGTSLTAPERVIRHWNVPGLDYGELVRRSERYQIENNVHLRAAEEINENNRLFVEGSRKAGYAVAQFPVNVKGCRG